MHPGEMIVAIVFLVVMASIVNNWIKVSTPKHDKRTTEALQEADNLRQQIIALEDRIRVLERIVTDTNSRDDLRRQFRDLSLD